MLPLLPTLIEQILLHIWMVHPRSERGSCGGVGANVSLKSTPATWQYPFTTSLAWPGLHNYFLLSLLFYRRFQFAKFRRRTLACSITQHQGCYDCPAAVYPGQLFKVHNDVCILIGTQIQVQRATQNVSTEHCTSHKHHRK